MSNMEVKVPDSSFRQKSETSESPSPTYVMAPQPYYMDDEISLVDLIRVIIKHKTVLALVFLLVSLASLVSVLVMPKKYEYQTVIELGSYMLPNEQGVLSERRYIEGLNQSKSKLEKRFITQVVNQYINESGNPADVSVPKFSVSAPKNGNLLILTTQWIEEGDQVIALENQIANNLVQDHLVLANEILEQARQRKENYELELKTLSAEAVNLQGHDKVLRQKLARIEEEEVLLSAQLARLDGEIKNLIQQKAAYLSDKTAPKEAMAILLIDNELKQIRDHRDSLEIDLKIALKNRQAELEKSIQNNKSQIEIAQANEANVRKILARFNIDRVNNVIKTNGVENSSGTREFDPGQFQLIHPTQVVVKPNRSYDPVGMSRTVQLAIGLIAGLFLGLMACFVAELVDKVRTGETRRSEQDKALKAA